MKKITEVTHRWKRKEEYLYRLRRQTLVSQGFGELRRYLYKLGLRKGREFGLRCLGVDRRHFCKTIKVESDKARRHVEPLVVFFFERIQIPYQRFLLGGLKARKADILLHKIDLMLKLVRLQRFGDGFCGCRNGVSHICVQL
jgi:hypothetical protein